MDTGRRGQPGLTAEPARAGQSGQIVCERSLAGTKGVPVTNSKTITLYYGRHKRFTCEVKAQRVAAAPAPPEALPDLRGALRRALRGPLDSPPLHSALIPDDRVALALDRDVPQAPSLIGETWKVLAARHVKAANVTIIQPRTSVSALDDSPLADPRVELPKKVRDAVRWIVHDPDDASRCRYLASTTAGQRVYLARELIDADVVISIGSVSYDSLIGYRGTNSVFYPGLATADALERARGQAHRELGPDEDRPLRQLMDEVGWLLGTPFSIQVIASAGNGVSDVLAGSADAVLRRAKQLLAERWLVQLESRPEVVVAAVDCDAGGHGWNQIGEAVEAAHNLVARGGRIIVLSELSEPPGPGINLIRRCCSARDAIQLLRTFLPPDLIPATQLASSAYWARVYLLSQLDPQVVKGLFLVPLSGPEEAIRLLKGNQQCAFLSSAQHAYGRIWEPERSKR